MDVGYEFTIGSDQPSYSYFEYLSACLYNSFSVIISDKRNEFFDVESHCSVKRAAETSSLLPAFTGSLSRRNKSSRSFCGKQLKIQRRDSVVSSVSGRHVEKFTERGPPRHEASYC